MARPSKQPKKRGPYIAAAFFCDRTIEDKQDGALSAIRVIDHFKFTVETGESAEIPSEEHRLPIQINGLLMFKTGDWPGEHKVRLVLESPSGKKKRFSAEDQVLSFTPMPYGGANMRFGGTIMVKSDGLYWVHVFLDGKPMTSMPFQVTVERQEPPASPPSPPSDEPTNGKKPRSPK